MKNNSYAKVFVSGIFVLAGVLLFTSCNTEKKARDISEDSSFSSSILFAGDMKNKVQCFYDDDSRSTYTARNNNIDLGITLSGGDGTGLKTIATSGGKVLLSGGMTAFTETVYGQRYITGESNVSGRVNTNKMGYYYYEANLRGLSFVESKNNQVNFTSTGKVEYSAPSTQKDINVSLENFTFSGKVTKKGTPSFSFDASGDLSNNHVVAITYEYTGKASAIYVYYTTNDTSSNSYQGFLIESGKTNTIYIDISALKYDGLSLKSLEIRFRDAEKNDKFSITDIKIGYEEEKYIPEIGFEETFHTYSDKLVNDIRVIFDSTTEKLKNFGFIYTIPKKTVSQILEDEDSKYVGFAIKKAGILGFCLEPDDKTILEVSETEDSYIVTISIDISGVNVRNSSKDTSHLIYASEEKDFEGFKEAVYNERNPLNYEVLSQSFEGAGLTVQGYNTESGSYDLSVCGTGFNWAYKKENNNKYFGGKIKVNADNVDRKLYFKINGDNGSLEAAVLLDEEDVLLPIEPEVCKNFVGENEETYYEPGDPQYGVTVYPIIVDANSDATYTMLNIYQNWGLNPLKQISSISFHIGYYHLSTGVTESNCIAPYFVYGRDGWTLPDFRGCSGNMWGSQPQFNSVGRLRFVNYTKDGYEYYGEYTGTKINSSGPSYADIEYSYTLMDGDITYTLRHMEFPQNDENRTYYTMELEFNKSVTFENARESFTLFNFDGRFGAFSKLSYTDVNGELVTLNYDTSKVSSKETFVLSKEKTFATLYNTPNDSIMNFGYIVKSYDITVGGKKFNGNLVLRHELYRDGEGILNFMEIGIDADTLKFKKGDKISMEFILLPYGEAYQEGLDNVAKVLADSVLNPWIVSSVTTGTVVNNGYLAEVRCENNVAEFTVTGGRNRNVIRVDGFTKLTRPTIEILDEDGTWKEYKVNYYDFDGYQVTYTEDGYYSYSFVVYQENYNDLKTFRVSVK